MEKISDQQFVKAYRSAGLWFVALYMEEFLLRSSELLDGNSKDHLIEEIYDNGNNADKHEDGTRTRVNCLWRIIKAGRVREALVVASNSKRLSSESPHAAKAARDLLIKIERGEISIPYIK